MFKRHPVDNPTITYGFGAGSDKWGAVGHLGVDYGGYEGQPIYAPADGFVVWARGSAAAAGNTWEQIPGSGNNGNCIIINHAPENWATHTLYAHLSGFNVTEGQHVTAGQIIGYMGNTGYSFGTHLHWEMFIDYSEGQYPAGTFYGRVNPLDHFDVVTTTPIAPGASGGTSTTNTPEAPKEWYEMPIPNEDLTKIYNAVWHGAPGGKLINNRLDKRGEWPETALGAMTDRIIRQQLTPLRNEVAASQAQIKSLVGAIAAMSQGEPFDEAKLLAGVQAAASAGVKDAIASIETTVTINVPDEKAV
jgi:murein DD-endopeptidase MepM/ murein hydrolase activator NlpD